MARNRRRRLGNSQTAHVSLFQETARVSEVLEDRALLANLALTEAYLVSGTNLRQTSPLLGEQIEVRTSYSTSDLAADASYAIRITIDGVSVDHENLTNGAGLASGLWLQNFLHGYAEGGTKVVTVILDPLNQISEDNESDNTATFTFTPVQATTLPQKLTSFVTGNAGVDWRVTNFADLDPRPGILRDYMGGQFTYDTVSGGHDAIDLGPGALSGLDAGMSVYAAADGVVSSINDGEFDRQTAFGSNPPANYVTIDHGNGWKTAYWHLRRDSVSVQVGDIVTAGDFLGFVGSSGFSTGAHVHFSLLYNGHTLETMLDADTFWVTPPQYPDAYRHAILSGFSSREPTDSEWQEEPESMTTFVRGDRVYFWVIAGTQMPGDTRTIQYLRPDGTTHFEQTYNQGAVFYKASQWYYYVTLPANAQLGTWTAVWLQNGVELARRNFTVAAIGLPELRVERGTDYIRHERFTPIDFGTVTVGNAAPTQSFTITNQGTAPLSLGAVTLPVGFQLMNTPSSVVAAGSSTTLTVQLSTGIAGYFSGQLRLVTNDPDEPEFRIWLEGSVQETSAGVLIPGLSLRRAAEGSSFFANVRRTGSTAAALTVNLQSSDDSELVVPATVTIPAGARFVNFEIQALQDFNTDGDQRVLLTASAAGVASGQNELVVEDRFVGFDITQTDGTTRVRENGLGDTIQLVLTEQPASQVIIVVELPSNAEVSISQSSLVFDQQNWNVPQSLTVTAVDDLLEETDEVFAILFSVDGANSDARFASSIARSIDVVVADDESGPPVLTVPATVLRDTGLTLTWTPVTDAIRYEVWMNFSTGGVSQVVHQFVTATSLSLPGFSEMGLYRVWVRAEVSSGFTTRWSQSRDLRVTANIVLDAVPRYVETATPVFSWMPVSAAVRYEIWVDDVLNGRSRVIHHSDLTSAGFAVQAPLEMSLYRLWVRAFDQRGQATLWSARQEFFISPRPATNVTLLSTFDRTPTLTWQPVAGAISYEIWVRNSWTGEDLYRVSAVQSSSWMVPTDLQIARYVWWVRAFGNYGVTGLWSRGQDLFVGGQPVVQVPSVAANGLASFVWQSVEGAFNYQLQIDRLDVPQVRVVRLDTLTSTTWTTPTALSSGIYRVWIRAVSTGGELGYWSRGLDFQVN